MQTDERNHHLALCLCNEAKTGATRNLKLMKFTIHRYAKFYYITQKMFTFEENRYLSKKFYCYFKKQEYFREITVQSRY